MGHLPPAPWKSNKMLNILTFIMIYEHFIDIFTLVGGVDENNSIVITIYFKAYKIIRITLIAQN
jgi:hypothetical protein